MIAYACALQYWMEKSDLPTEGQPCHLAKSVKELWEEMKCYLSFSDREIFKGAAPHEGMPCGPTEGAESPGVTTMPSSTSQEHPVKETLPNPTKEKKYPGWEKVLHPSWPMVVAGQCPPLLRSPEWTYPLVANWDPPANKIPPEPTPFCKK